MKLKCIGGRCDGMTVDISEHARYRQGEAVRVFDYPTEISTIEFTPTSTISANYYIVDVLKYSHKKNDVSEIWFLRPENFTVFDAIQFQFNKK